MFNTNKDIDLLVPYNYEEPFYIKHRAIIKMIIPVVVIILVFGGVFAFLRLGISNTQNKISESQQALSELQTQAAKNAELDSVYNAYQNLVRTNNNIKAINTALDSYPTLTKNALVSIEAACIRSTIKNIIYNEENGYVQIYLETEDVTQGENIVKTLKSLHYFASVSHQGYTGNETSTTTDEKTETKLKYNMIITCQLEGGN